MDSNGNVNGIDLHYIMGTSICSSNPNKIMSLNIELTCAAANGLKMVSPP